MRNWQDVLVKPDAPMRDALAVIDRTGSQIALVGDAERRLLGTLSDGDIRRALLNGVALERPVERAMFRNPTCARASEDRATILATMRRRGLHRFNLCGIIKARAVLLWHALAHNLMRLAALKAAPAS